MCKFWPYLSVVCLLLSFLDIASARSATNSQYQQINAVPNVVPHQKTVDSSNNLNDESATATTGTQNIWKDLSFVYKIYQQCASEDVSMCLKVKLLAGLERVFRATKSIKLMEGVQFVAINDEATKDDSTPKAALLSEQDIEAILPRAAAAKEYVLNNMIFKKISSFLQDHTLQIKFPDIRNMDVFNDIESRKKKDKKGGGAYIMIPLLLGGTFVPIAYGALAMLAGKALIVSKLALVLASIIGIKKLLSGGGKESSHEVVVSSGSHSGWGRDIDLAYNAWKPAKEIVKTH